MTNQITRKLGAIILAAGKGKRMQLANANKVTARLAEKPLIVHIVDFMRSLAIQTIVVVVGHQKESVQQALQEQNVLFAHQSELLGTGDAVRCALEVLPDTITDVLVVYGDDAILYAEKNIPTLKKLFHEHEEKNDQVTLLTIEQDNPFDLGRIVRDKSGNIVAIVEEKDATEEQRKLTEINPGCFLFSVAFLKEYLPKLSKSSVTGEYYVTKLIDLAVANSQSVNALQGGKMAWRGINTKEELAAAEKLYNTNNK